MFNFNNQYSLHDPEVEIEQNLNQDKNLKSVVKKNKITKIKKKISTKRKVDQ